VFGMSTDSTDRIEEGEKLCGAVQLNGGRRKPSMQTISKSQ